MSTIETDAAFALYNAIDSQITMTTPELLNVIRVLDDSGWQLTRKPEPVVEPPPQTPIVPPVALSDRWLPAHIFNLWTEGPDGKPLPVQNEHDLRNKARGCLTFFEAQTSAEAAILFRDPTSSTIERFVLNGETYEYRTDTIPF